MWHRHVERDWCHCYRVSSHGLDGRLLIGRLLVKACAKLEISIRHLARIILPLRSVVIDYLDRSVDRVTFIRQFRRALGRGGEATSMQAGRRPTEG